ncbi:glycerate kinase type-2 family protein [Lacipirellula sp.]|uniref:glycerate kinase type-2 family protein n=1 Tax=Lacipirellula sp. TaxID=2691419 RepID=UPI003D10DAE1
MQRTSLQLRNDALQIWHAGLEAVRSPRLIANAVEVSGGVLQLAKHEFDLAGIERIAVVGGGKAGAGMAVALEQRLGADIVQAKRLTGVVNVPADCVEATVAIELHVGRAAGINEPTEEGLRGVERMLELLAALGPRDLCICLVSGGGSALMPAPVAGLSIAEKAALTRELSACGATIEEINAVRKSLSRVKGGGLAEACRAGRLVSLIISDVMGDDGSMVSSGPTALGTASPAAALRIIDKYALTRLPAGVIAVDLLQKRMAERSDEAPAWQSRIDGVNRFGCCVHNAIVGDNNLAVMAATRRARELGYAGVNSGDELATGDVNQVAAGIAAAMNELHTQGPLACLISGEPTVKLCSSERRGRGGRNQHLALALASLRADWRGTCFVSGGTDGEDGPTNAAGAFVDDEVVAAAMRQHLDFQSHLARNDSFTFFSSVDALLHTGPTHTNVCDLRVAVADPALR